MAISAGFSLTCEVSQLPGTSACSAAHEASISSLHDSANRGVTAYRMSPAPCQRLASANPSS